MALQVQNLQRVFEMKKEGKTVNFADPNPELAPEEVVKFYSSTYPELTNGVITGPAVVGDKATFSISTKAGKLG